MGAKTSQEYVKLIESIVAQTAESASDIEELSPRVIAAYLGTLTAFIAAVMEMSEVEANYDPKS